MKENETKTQNKKGSKALKTVINTIINILIVLVLIVSITIAVMSISSKANGGMSVLFGHTIENIQTDSMKGGSAEYEGGNFEHGDVIIGLFTDNDASKKYAVGDIITYQDDVDGDDKKDNICHRIIEVNEYDGVECYRTKGDNGAIADQQEGDLASYLTARDIAAVFYSSDYQGKIIKGLGNVLTFLQTKFGFFICVLLPMIIFFMYELVRVVFNAAYYRKAKEDEDKSKADAEKQAAVDAAVAQALGEQDPGAKEPADMSPEEMEQFKQFLEFRRQQKAQNEQTDDTTD